MRLIEDTALQDRIEIFDFDSGGAYLSYVVRFGEFVDAARGRRCCHRLWSPRSAAQGAT